MQKVARYIALYNNQINARALIGQSAMFYCASKLVEKSRVFWIIIFNNYSPKVKWLSVNIHRDEVEVNIHR